MAQFPTSAKSFTARSNGQTIDASHVGDLQDEVAAIEDDYLNGAARLNSSNSTVANLSVSGGSTFAGAVTFTTPQPRVRVSISADAALPSGSFVGLNWNVETYDTDGMHSTSANSSRLTFAHSSGVYQIGAQLDINANSSGFVSARILLNDSTASVVAGAGGVSPSAVNMPLNLSADYLITSTADYATVQVFQNSGSTRSVSSTGIYGVSFWARKVL